MHMDTVKSTTDDASPVTVQKVAYCDAHCPAVTGGNENMNLSSAEAERLRQQSRNKMKQARKTLAMKRESVPLILIPTIPADRVQQITSLVHFQKKTQFIQRLIAYWTLKRQHRNGVPLLRRLQSQGQVHQSRGIEGSPNASELNQQLKYWQCLRQVRKEHLPLLLKFVYENIVLQDLERARLLCELVRKREKLKALYIRTVEQSILMRLNPLEEAMTRLLDSIFTKDAQEIFTEPVDVEEVPDYMDVVTQPMDLSTMRSKLREGKYETLDDMENDFNLMIQNCLAYNNKDTIFYRAGVRMRDQCGPLFKAVRKELIRDGIVEKPQSDESIAHEVDTELASIIKQNLPHDEFSQKLQDLMEKAMRIKHGMIRQKRVKNIKAEMVKAKKSLNRKSDSFTSPSKSTVSAKGMKRLPSPMETSQSEDQDDINKIEEALQTTPACSPIKNVSNSASPSGVNRRTAVLFTRKAKAASLKKLEAPIENETNTNTDLPSSKQQNTSLQTSTPSNTTSNNDSPKIKSPKKSSKSGRNNSLTSEGGAESLGNSSNSKSSSGASVLAVPSTSSSSSGLNNISKKISPITKERYAPSNIMPDSFRTYRGRGMTQSSDSEDSMNMSCMHSECSSCSGSEFG